MNMYILPVIFKVFPQFFIVFIVSEYLVRFVPVYLPPHKYMLSKKPYMLQSSRLQESDNNY